MERATQRNVPLSDTASVTNRSERSVSTSPDTGTEVSTTPIASPASAAHTTTAQAATSLTQPGGLEQNLTHRAKNQLPTLQTTIDALQISIDALASVPPPASFTNGTTSKSTPANRPKLVAAHTTPVQNLSQPEQIPHQSSSADSATSRHARPIQPAAFPICSSPCIYPAAGQPNHSGQEPLRAHSASPGNNIYSRENIVELLNAMTKLQRQFQHLVTRRHGPAEPTRQPSADNADTIKHHGQCATQHNHLEHPSGSRIKTALTTPRAAQHTNLARNQNMTRSVRSLNLHNPGGHTPPTPDPRKRKHSPR